MAPVRALVVALVLLGTWLVASPAAAYVSRAPLCDERGAITFAPAPLLMEPLASMDAGAGGLGAGGVGAVDDEAAPFAELPGLKAGSAPERHEQTAPGPVDVVRLGPVLTPSAPTAGRFLSDPSRPQDGFVRRIPRPPR